MKKQELLTIIIIITHVPIVIETDTQSAIINVTMLNRSYKLIDKQASKPTKKQNTFHFRENNDIDRTVIVKDV